jgi:hypothetical protein
MGSDHTRSLGIRFILRHSLIPIAYLAILFQVIIPPLKISGHQSAWSLLMPTLMISPPLLALLVVIVGRAGPIKNWCVSLLMFLFYPALVLNHDRIALLDYMREGRLPSLWMTLLLNAILAIFTLKFVVKMTPRTCPDCQKRTVIPLMRLFKNEQRSSNTSWCASCGGKYWKDQEGNWRAEQRTTWLDGPKTSPTLKGMTASPGGRPELSETADRPLGRQAANELHPS